MSDERLIDLEIKIAHQDHLLDVLNKTVYEQQKKIDDLERLCTELARRLKDIASNANERMPANEKPPHY
ncbi:MAG TPA: SlyX family protein [Paucimonas sp.]|nr:SlyX family protein [Paucimonas sp.]